LRLRSKSRTCEITKLRSYDFKTEDFFIDTTHNYIFLSQLKGGTHILDISQILVAFPLIAQFEDTIEITVVTLSGKDHGAVLNTIILGILNIKDYFFYKPGGIGTEMPLKLRPRMKAMVKRITSIKGAFIIGILVTLFLLPCTIGPYFIFSGEASKLSFLSTLPLLFLYNIIFIVPMIIITLAIFVGVTSVNKISGWKERNIKYLHLIEGLILTILGILMVSGII